MQFRDNAKICEIESHGFCPLVFLWKALEGEGRFSSHSHSDGVLRKLLEARVGIDPENSISGRKIAEFPCQSMTIPHYPGTIFPLSFHSTLLAILLAIMGMDFVNVALQRGRQLS